MLFSVQGEQGLLDYSKPPLLFCKVSPGGNRLLVPPQDLWTTIESPEPHFIPQNLDSSELGCAVRVPRSFSRSPCRHQSFIQLAFIYAFQTLFLATSHQVVFLGLSIPTPLLPVMLSNPLCPCRHWRLLALVLLRSPFWCYRQQLYACRNVYLTVLPERLVPNHL